MAHLKKTFEPNGYPTSFIKKVPSRSPPPSRESSSGDKEEEGEKEPKLLYLPYICGVRKMIECGCRGLGVRTVFKSRHTLRQSLMKVKNHIPDEQKRGVVYKIPCAECETVGIGETGCSLNDTSREHKYVVKRRDLRNGIAAHACATDHAED